MIIYYLHAKNRNSIKKMIMILNKHLLISIGEREYTYRFADDEEYIIPGLICTIYLSPPKDIKEILKYNVKNGIVYMEISKTFRIMNISSNKEVLILRR